VRYYGSEADAAANKRVKGEHEVVACEPSEAVDHNGMKCMVLDEVIFDAIGTGTYCHAQSDALTEKWIGDIQRLLRQVPPKEPSMYPSSASGSRQTSSLGGAKRRVSDLGKSLLSAVQAGVKGANMSNLYGGDVPDTDPPAHTQAQERVTKAGAGVGKLKAGGGNKCGICGE
jgi:hypothetical protein